MNTLEIVDVNLSDQNHAEAVLLITDHYAQDPMGIGKELPDETKKTLTDRLKEFQHYIGFLAYIDSKPAGLANCFYGFSTFKASKIINIHDLAVMPRFRGKGIGEALLAAVERKAVAEKCCKITLEVREDNRARRLYDRFGFSYGKPKMLFMEKELS